MTQCLKAFLTFSFQKSKKGEIEGERHSLLSRPEIPTVGIGS